MNNVKKIGLLLLVSGMLTASTQAAEKPDATVRLTSKAIAAGVGFGWGKGTLTYKGRLSNFCKRTVVRQSRY